MKGNTLLTDLTVQEEEAVNGGGVLLTGLAASAAVVTTARGAHDFGVWLRPHFRDAAKKYEWYK